MRKSRAAVVGTVGTVMIGAGWAAGLISTAASADSSGISLVADATTDTATSPGAAASESPTASASASESAAPSETATPSETASTDTSTSTQAAPAETAPAAPAGVTGTYTGATVQTRYGNYQVSLSISDGVITAVNILQDGDTDRESMQIKSRSEPTIISRVLEAQTYNVSGVSGASYTSQGMLLSVKSAMQSAGLA